MPGVPAINLVLGLYNYKPSSEGRQGGDRAADQGHRGRRARRASSSSTTSTPTWRASTRAWRWRSRTSPKFTRTDIYALNAIKSQFLGEGGGEEVDNALFLDGLRSKLGAKTGDKAFEDLRARNDPEATYTTRKAAPNQTDVSVSQAVRHGAAEGRDVQELVRQAARRHGVGRRRRASPSAGKRQLASNILIVSGSKSATGKPLFVGGPQIGFNYPGLTMEMQLTSPSINVEGVTSAPFPGYMLIGRGADYAWSLTSAGADIIDTYAETAVRRVEDQVRLQGQVPVDGEGRRRHDRQGRQDGQGRRFYRTVHGPVIGYAKDAKTGKRSRCRSKRSSYGRETVDQLFNQQMTYSRVHSAKRLHQRRGQKSPQTFNSFYASATESAFYTSGALPVRPKGVNGDLPVDGTRQVRVEGRAGHEQAPAGRQPVVGLHRQLEQQAGQELPGR